MASRRVEKLVSDTNARISGGALGAEYVAVGEEGGDVEGSRPEGAAVGAYDHVSQSRVERKGARALPICGQAALRSEQAKLGEQLTRAGKWTGRGGAQPLERRRILNSRRREIEGKRSEVGLDNLRQRAGNQLLMFVPEAMARPRSRAAGAAATLIGGRPRNAHRLETSHAGARRKARPPYQPGIDDDAHARNREARLGDRRREYYSSSAGDRRADRGVLRFARQAAVQRNEIDLGLEVPV